MDPIEQAFTLHFLAEGFQYPAASWDKRFRAQRAEAAGEKIPLPAFSAEALAPEYFRLFGPAPACPLELSLHLAENPFEQARIMAHMAGFYRAFGVEQEPGERSDNLPVALSFLSFLRLKEKNAMDKGLTEAREVTAKAIQDFVQEFLAPGVAAFTGKLHGLTSHAFYLTLAEHLRREIFAIHTPVVKPESRWEPRDNDMEEGDMTCGVLKQPLPQ